MSYSSSNNMEEDAWLKKIELKREEPVEAVRGDESKEVTINHPPIFEQALPTEEEEQDILKPYLAHLTPAKIEAFHVIKIVLIQNKYLTHENILHQEHIIHLRSVIRRLENLFIHKDRISSSSSSPSSSPK